MLVKKTMKAKILKLLSLVTAFSLLADAAAIAVPINYTSQRETQLINVSIDNTINNIFIPESFGTIEKALILSQEKHVVIIKDAHCNYEAQTNIAKILDTLIRDYKIDLVCVEGAEGSVDTQPFKSFPDKEAKKKVADKYVKKGVLTASEALSISKGNNLPFSIWGIEDSLIYLEDFKAFRETLIGNSENARIVKCLAQTADILKKKVYNAELLKFDRGFKDYKENKTKLSDWVISIRSKANGPDHYKNIIFILKSIRLENQIDFNKVERERTYLIKELENLLPKEELKELVKKSLLFRLGKISQASYYTYLMEITPDSLQIHNLAKYTRLVKIQSMINSDDLFKEMDSLESGIYARLCRTELERKLHKIDINLSILNKLFHLQMSREDLDYYRAHINEFDLEKIKDFINIQCGSRGIDLADINTHGRLSLQSAERFYELALKRDQVLVDNLLKKLETDKKQRAVMVIGGFHAEGIKRKLEKEGISYTVISPRITDLQKDNPYLSIMLNDKVDIDKMIEDISATTLSTYLLFGNIGNIDPGVAKGARSRLAKDLILYRKKSLAELVRKYTTENIEAYMLKELCQIANISDEEIGRILTDETKIDGIEKLKGFLNPDALADRIIAEQNTVFAAFLLELLKEQRRDNPEQVKSALEKVFQKEIVNVEEDIAREKIDKVRDAICEDVAAITAMDRGINEEYIKPLMQRRKEESLERLKMTERTGSIDSAISALCDDARELIGMQKDPEKKKQAAILIMSIFHILLLQDEADLKLPFVPHSIRHSLNVRGGVKEVIENSQKVRESLKKAYGSEEKGKMIALLTAWLHDIGYSIFNDAEDKAKELAGRLGIEGYKTGKGYHANLGVPMASANLTDNMTILKLMDGLFGLSEMEGRAAGSKNALMDIAITIMNHGAYYEEIKRDGLRGTGKNEYRPASLETDILVFLVRLSDNMDLDAHRRLYSHHNNPFFIDFLRSLSLEEQKGIIEVIKREFVESLDIYEKAYSLYLQEKQGIGKGEADQKAKDDFAVIVKNIRVFDSSNFPHFAGMIGGHKVTEEDGRLVIRVKLNTGNRLIPKNVLEYQVERMRRAFESLTFSEDQKIEIKIEDSEADKKESRPLPEILKKLKNAIEKLPEGDRQRLLLLAVFEYAKRNPDLIEGEELFEEGREIIKEGFVTQEDLVKEEEHLKYVYILLNGVLEVYQHGQREPLAKIDKPGLVGEMMVITGRRTASVKGSGSGEMLKITRDKFLKLLQDPQFVVEYAKLVRERERQQKITAHEIKLGGDRERSGGVLVTPFIGYIWIKAGRYFYKVWIEDSQVKLQRYDNKDGNPVDSIQNYSLGKILSVGRSSDNDLAVGDGLMSRNHFTLKVTQDSAGQYMLNVEDIKSKNGTKIMWETPENGAVVRGEFFALSKIVKLINGRNPFGVGLYMEIPDEKKGKVKDSLSSEARRYLDIELFEINCIFASLGEYGNSGKALENRRNKDALSRLQERVFEIGGRNTISAHGIHTEKGGLGTLLKIVLDGRLRSDYTGPLIDGDPNYVSGPHGPFYIIINPYNRDYQKLEYHRAYLVPEEIDRQWLINMLGIAVEEGLIDESVVRSVTGKIITYEEFVQKADSGQLKFLREENLREVIRIFITPLAQQGVERQSALEQLRSHLEKSSLQKYTEEIMGMAEGECDAIFGSAVHMESMRIPEAMRAEHYIEEGLTVEYEEGFQDALTPIDIDDLMRKAKELARDKKEGDEIIIEIKAKEITYKIFKVRDRRFLVQKEILEKIGAGNQKEGEDILAIKLLSILQQDELEKLPSRGTFLITMLKRSPRLFEDHASNGFIGINEAFFKLWEEINALNNEILSGYMDSLLEMGLEHELRHETGIESEDIQREIDRRRIIKNLGDDVEEFLDFLNTKGVIDREFKEEVLRYKIQKPSASRGVINEVVSGVSTLADSAYIMGDIHADLDALIELLRGAKLIKEEEGEWVWNGGEKTLVQLGDIFDRGPKPIETMDFLLKLQTQARKAGGRVILLLGNHELGYIQKPKKDLRREKGDLFTGLELNRYDELRRKILENVRNGNIQAAYHISDTLFVHAGVKLDLYRNIAKSKGKDDVSVQEIAEYCNHTLGKVVSSGDFSDPIFEKGEDGIGFSSNTGIFWARFNKGKKLQPYKEAEKLPPFRQVVGHEIVINNVEERKIIKIEDKGSGGKVIFMDLGASVEYYGGRGFMRIDPRGTFHPVEKRGDRWRERGKWIGRLKWRIFDETGDLRQVRVVSEIIQILKKYGIEVDSDRSRDLEKTIMRASSGKVEIDLLKLMEMLAEKIEPEKIFQLAAEIAEPLNRFLGADAPTKGGQIVAAVLQEILELIPEEKRKQGITAEEKLINTVQAIAVGKGIDPNAIRSVLDLFRAGVEILRLDPDAKIDANYIKLIEQIEKLTGINDKKIIEAFTNRGLLKERAKPVDNSPLEQEVRKLEKYLDLIYRSSRGDLDLEFDLSGEEKGLFNLGNLKARIERGENKDIQFLSGLDVVNKDMASAYEKVQDSPDGYLVDRKDKVALVISADAIIDYEIEGKVAKFSYRPGIQALLKTVANSENIHIVIRASGIAEEIIKKSGMLNKQVTLADSEMELDKIDLKDKAEDRNHVVFIMTPEEGERKRGIIEKNGLKAFGLGEESAFHAALLFGLVYAHAQRIDEIRAAINCLKSLGMKDSEVDEILGQIKGDKPLTFFVVNLIRIEDTLERLQNCRLYIDVAA